MGSMPKGANVAGATEGRAKLASDAVPMSGKPVGGALAPLRQATPTKTQYHTGPAQDAKGGNAGGGGGGRKRYR